MIFSILVLGVTLLIAYMWVSQGLFSSLIHFVCTLVAGAVAFALWEPLTNAFLLGMRQDIAWSVGLMGPFLITLLLLRIVSDKMVIANMDFDNMTNMIGGAAFGLGSGVISAGLLVISIGFLRLPPDFLGFQQIGYDSTGNVSRQKSLLLPVDSITSKLYEKLSLSGFSTATPLAIRDPDLYEQAAAIRLTFDGRSRTTLSRDDFKLVGAYRVTAPSLTDLLKDNFSVNQKGEQLPAQKARQTNGEPYPPGSEIHGFVLKFTAGAKEDGGQIVIGPGQLRLIGRDSNGKSFAVHPIAVITQAVGDQLAFGRFRFDAKDVYAASVGGQASSTMAFEFVTPPGAELFDLLVKNIRVAVSSIPQVADTPEEGYSVDARDEAIQSLSLLGMSSVANIDTSNATTVTTTDSRSLRKDGFYVSNRLPKSFNKQNRGGLDLNKDNEITSGQNTFLSKEMNPSVPKQLKVEKFAEAPGTAIVQIEVGLESKFSLLGKSVQMGLDILPPVLIDTIGQQYEAVGWIFTDGPRLQIRFKPGQPVRALKEIPNLSRSRPDQKLTLLFQVTKRVDIRAFSLGSKVQQAFDPPIHIR